MRNGVQMCDWYMRCKIEITVDSPILAFETLRKVILDTGTGCTIYALPRHMVVSTR
jgi:flagellar assembly factor FliW